MASPDLPCTPASIFPSTSQPLEARRIDSHDVGFVQKPATDLVLITRPGDGGATSAAGASASVSASAAAVGDGNGAEMLTDRFPETDFGDGYGGPAQDCEGGGGGYGCGGAGGKLRSSRRTLARSRKKTPYDRPASGRHATPGGAAMAASVSSSSSSSIASRLVDSASRLISSSASYLFSSFFGRRPLSIDSGDAETAGEEEQDKDAVEAPVNQDDKPEETHDRGPLMVENCAGTAKRELDLVQVEEILKQRTWSRDQVERLTGILQTRVRENNPVGLQSEAQRWREEFKKARDDPTPIEIARAYMGERTPRPSRLTASTRGISHQVDRVAELQPPPGLGLAGDRFRPSPVRTLTQSPAAVQIPRKRYFREDDWASAGPIRRTQQKLLTPDTSSPYARGMTGASKPPRPFMSPPIQSSQTARRILETLEKLTPSPKGKPLDEELEGATERPPTELTPDTSNFRVRKSMQMTEFPTLPKTMELGPSSIKLAREVHSGMGNWSTPGPSTGVTKRNVGLRTSAIIEESSLDEEGQQNAKSPARSDGQFHALFPEAREAPLLVSSSGVKTSLVPVPTAVSSDAPVSRVKFSLMAAQSRVAPILAIAPPLHSNFVSSVSSLAALGSSKSEKAPSFSLTSTKFFSSSADMETTPVSKPSPAASAPSVLAAAAVAASSVAAALPGVTSLASVASPPAALVHAPTSPTTASVIENLSDGEKGGGMRMQSTGVDKQVEGNYMEEGRDTTVVSSSPALPLVLPCTIASASPEPIFLFGTGCMSSPSFALESAATPALSFSTGYTFGHQSTPSSGPRFPFKAPSTPGPFSLSTSASSTPAFTFWSPPAATSSTLSAFPATSSAPPTFSFQVSSVSSSFSSPSSASQPFGFSVQNLPSSSTGATSSPAVTFASSPAAASPIFSFGKGVGTSVSSGPVARQSFGFDVQSSSVASPFSVARSSNSAPSFSFASSFAESTKPAFAFGSSAVSLSVPTFGVGAQSAASPLSSSQTSFTSGGQTGASLAGLPFSFGGQPTASAPGPFSSVGASNTSSQTGSEFASGYGLGTTGGEKSARKFIKAKRMAGAKRGK